ncbi:hypothetical protein [Streptococcus phage 140]|nr:hypothetical protein [Streptococcus phage 140]
MRIQYILFYSSLALLVARLEFKIKGVVNKKKPKAKLAENYLTTLLYHEKGKTIYENS